jgi:hypothetical protein
MLQAGGVADEDAATAVTGTATNLGLDLHGLAPSGEVRLGSDSEDVNRAREAAAAAVTGTTTNLGLDLHGLAPGEKSE